LGWAHAVLKLQKWNLEMDDNRDVDNKLGLTYIDLDIIRQQMAGASHANKTNLEIR